MIARAFQAAVRAHKDLSPLCSATPRVAGSARELWMRP